MAWAVAAVNYNSKRRPFTPYVEFYDGKLGSVYTLLTEMLVHRGDWKRKRAERSPPGTAPGTLKLPRHFHLLLGTAQGKGIPWEEHGYYDRPTFGLVNYFFDFELLTQKARLVSTLRRAELTCRGGWPRDMPANLMSTACTAGGTACGIWEVMPPSFVFDPFGVTHDFWTSFHAAFVAKHSSDRGERGAPHAANVWIVKPSTGCKGNGIFLSSSFAEIADFLEEEWIRACYGEFASTWVVQQYIANPLTLTGGRKCDMRVWVLLDADYSIWLYMHGVVRIAAVAYRPDALEDHFSHLTNHCIAQTHRAFGTYERSNELLYPEFDAQLARQYPQLLAKDPTCSILDDIILPQIRRIVTQSLLAARPRLQPPPHLTSSGPRSFQLFGYDFVLDTDLRAWLCEVSARAAPNVARHVCICTSTPPLMHARAPPTRNSATLGERLAGGG